jgi:hypothetical protein
MWLAGVEQRHGDGPVHRVECGEQLLEERGVRRRHDGCHKPATARCADRTVVADHAPERSRLARGAEDVCTQRRQLATAGAQRLLHRLKPHLQSLLALQVLLGPHQRGKGCVALPTRGQLRQRFSLHRDLRLKRRDRGSQPGGGSDQAVGLRSCD